MDVYFNSTHSFDLPCLNELSPLNPFFQKCHKSTSLVCRAATESEWSCCLEIHLQKKELSSNLNSLSLSRFVTHSSSRAEELQILPLPPPWQLPLLAEPRAYLKVSLNDLFSRQALGFVSFKPNNSSSRNSGKKASAVQTGIENNVGRTLEKMENQTQYWDKEEVETECLQR